MNRKEYNGWTNYETWAVALWLDNEQGSHEAIREQARELLASKPETLYASQTNEDRYKCILADSIKEQHEEANPCADRSDVFADLMVAALSEVNWYEIAEHYVDAEQAALQETERG